MQNDPVNHPSHYTYGTYETIDFIESQNFDFCIANAVKYISRAGVKDPLKTKEDLEKAIWYIQRKEKRKKRPKLITATQYAADKRLPPLLFEAILDISTGNYPNAVKNIKQYIEEDTHEDH